MVPLAAMKIRDSLRDFWQWSDLSAGHKSVEDLMDSCVLGADGKVQDPVKVTELSAHAWVPAAEMYLHMRVFR